MVTKKTRWLSALAAVIMLISMCACIIVPASAETGSVILTALQKKYDLLQQESFVEIKGRTVAEMQALIADLIDDYANAENVYEREIYEDTGRIADEEFVAENDGNLVPDLIVRYAAKAYYEEMGLSPDASAFYISTVEDWEAAAKSGSEFGGVTLSVTNDIDFKGELTTPLTTDAITFKGVLDGQGFRFINVVINVPQGSNHKYGGLVAALGGTIKDLGLDGGSVSFAGKDMYTDRNEGVGSFAGYIGKGALLQNCWSTMTVSNTGPSDLIQDGKNGVAGLVGWGEGGAIDNCFFTGVVNNPGEKRAAADLIGYTANAVKIYNSIGAGTLNCGSLRNPAAIGLHYTVYANPDGFGVYNSYGVGHNALRYRTNANPWNMVDSEGVCYVAYPNTDITTTKDIVHKYTPEASNAAYTLNSLEEAVWAVNARFDTTHQTEREYTICVDENGKLYMSRTGEAYRKVTIAGSASGVYYLKEGSKVNLLKDLNLLAAKSIIIDKTEYASALKGYDLTVPAGDITITITYDENSEANLAATELAKLVAGYEKLDSSIFVGGNVMDEWLVEAKKELAKASYDLEMLKVLLEIEDQFGSKLTLKDGVYPSYSEYETYVDFNQSQEWGITSASDWLKMVEDTKGNTNFNFKGHTFYLTQDIDFKNQPMAPLCYGGIFMGTIEGQGYGFENILINEETLTEDQPIGLISYAEDCTIRNFSIKSGLIDASKTKWARNTGAFFGYVNASTTVNTFHVYKCWNNAEVRGATNTYQGAGALAGAIATTGALTDILINGFYNSGKVTSNSSSGNELYVGVIHSAGTFYCATGVFNCLNSGAIGGLKNANDVNRGPMFVRVKAAVQNATKFGNNAVVKSDKEFETPVIRFHITDGAVPYAQVSILEQGAYESGEMGYLLNQGNKGLVDQHGRAVTPVYYTFDEDGRIAFGADDGSDQLRKITFTGDKEGVCYWPAGKVFDIETVVAGGSYSVVTSGYASALSGAKLTVPNADITIKVTGSDLIDGAIHSAAKDLLSQYLSLDENAFTNGAELAAMQSTIKQILEDDAASTASSVKKATIAYAEQAKALVLDIKNTGSYFVPYSQKDGIYANVDPKGQYGIFTEADWVAAVASGSDFAGITLNLINNIALEEGQIPTFNIFKGTFNGNGLTISGIDMVLTGGASNSIFGTVTGKINDLTLEGKAKITLGSAKAPVENDIYIAAFSALAAGSTLTDCVNKIAFDVEAYTKGELYVGGVAAKATNLDSCANNAAINVVGSAKNIYVGGIAAYANGDLLNCANRGVITVTDKSVENSTGSAAYTIVGGVVAASENNSITGAVNAGAIKVNGGRYMIVAGVAADCIGSDGEINGAVNEGAIYAAAAPKADARYVAVGGIFGRNTFLAKGALSNSGKIDVYAAASAQTYIAGVAARMNSKATSISAINSGDIFAGGLKDTASGFRKVDGITTSKTTQSNCTLNGTITICDHAKATGAHIANTNKHEIACDCSYYTNAACAVTYTQNAITFKDGEIVATHAGACALCGYDYSGACTGVTLVDSEKDCTIDSYYTFNCICGRAKYEVVGSGEDDHDWTDWEKDLENLKWVRNCQNCEEAESKSLDIDPAIEISATEVKAGDKDVSVVVKMAAGMGAKLATLNVAFPAWAENIRIAPAANVLASQNTLTITDTKKGGEELFTVTFDVKKTAVGDGAIKITATDVFDMNGEAAAIETVEGAVTIDIILGDANVDSTVSLIDAIAVLNAMVGKTENVNLANADVNSDGKVLGDDAILIVRWWLPDPKYNGPVLGK